MLFHLHLTGVLTLTALFALGEPARTFKIPRPTLISPANGTVMDNGCRDKSNGVIWDFDWSDVPDATAYDIRVWHYLGIPWIRKTSLVTSDYHHESPQDYFSKSTLIGWRWMVRAKVGSVWGPWSRVGFFRIERLNTDCPK